MSWSTPILIYSQPQPESKDLEPIGGPDSLSDATVVRLGALTKLELDPDQVFQKLHDPEILVSLLPGSSLTRIVDARNFKARASIGVGPLHLGYDAEACVTASDPGARTASMTVQARPRGLGMPFRVRMAMAVNPMGAGSRIEMRIAVAISGSRVPQAWLDRITCDVLEGAVHELKGQLDASSIQSIAPAS